MTTEKPDADEQPAPPPEAKRKCATRHTSTVPAEVYTDPGMAPAGRSRVQRSAFMQRRSRFELGHD